MGILDDYRARLAEEAGRSQPEPAPVKVTANVTALDPARVSRYAAKALAEEVSDLLGATEGERNDALNKAAFALGQLIGAGHLGRADVENQLRTAALHIGLTMAETEKTLASGIESGLAEPRQVELRETGTEVREVDAAELGSAVGQVAEPGAGSEPAEPPEAGGPLLNEPLDWHALWADETEEEWIIYPLLPARRMVALFSPPKAGKSLLMLELATGIARGTASLGQPVDRARRVLYVDFENDPLGDVRTRLIAMGMTPDDLGNLVYLSFPSLAKLDSPTGGLDLLRHVEAYDCEVVVIDTVSRAVAGEENDNDTWLAFYRNTGVMLKAKGIACIRLDHTGKDQQRGMRGGSAKEGDVDAAWRLTALSEDTIQIECTAHRMVVAETVLTLTRDSDPLRHRVNGNPHRAAAHARMDQIIAILDGLGLPVEASVRDCRGALKAGSFQVNNDTLSAAVRERKRGLVEEVDEV